jgi:hypothetical protein
MAEPMKEFKVKTDVGVYEPVWDEVTLILWDDGTVSWKDFEKGVGF